MLATDNYLLLEFEPYNRYGYITYDKFHDFFSADYLGGNKFSVHENKFEHWKEENKNYVQMFRPNPYNDLTRYKGFIDIPKEKIEYVLETSDNYTYIITLRTK